MISTNTVPSKSAKSWLKVTIEAPSEAAEPIAAFVADLTGSGVEYTQQTDGSFQAGPEKIIGYIVNDQNRAAQEQQLSSFLADIQAHLPDSDTPRITLHKEIIEDEDWNLAWKQHFKPLRLTNRLTIKRTWEPYEPDTDEVVIEMDPGMAFGTGHHASTKLALEFIESLFFSAEHRPRKVLDVGTGTGILGMACAKFGAVEIVAIDNDPEAVAIASENIQNNDLGGIMAATTQDLASVSGPFDLIVANITHDILKVLAPSITKLLDTSGQLILSGLLSGEQLQSIKKIYQQHHLTVIETKIIEEWGAVLFTKQRQPETR